MHKENFKLWFSDVIESLYENEHAGFPILMLTFPLLERYCRSRSGIGEDSPLDDKFYIEIIKIFPKLRDMDKAKNFWHIYRNGILHQSTMSKMARRNKKKIQMPDGCLRNQPEAVFIDSSDSFYVNPVRFSEQIISVINNDFQCFEAYSFVFHPLSSREKSADGSYGTSGSGTRVPPNYEIAGKNRP